MSLKEKARAYIAAVNSHEEARVAAMITEDYIQHNPLVPTGRDAFLSFLPALKAHGSTISNLRMLEDGRHVIMQHRWEHALPFGHEQMEAFHIIRFNEENLIAEHWSVMRKEGGEFVKGPREIALKSRTAEHKAHVADLLTENFPRCHLHKVFGEGNFMLAISEDPDRKQAIYDLFRMDSFKITHHWQIAQGIPGENLKNSNTMFGFSSAV